VRTILPFFALVIATALASVDTFSNGGFAECCAATVLDYVRVAMSHSTVTEPASLALFGMGLSLVAVRCRENT
jgi:hypothetical protein